MYQIIKTTNTMNEPFILILQNNYTKDTYTFETHNQSSGYIYLEFNDINLPDTAQPGEYTYWVFYCNLNYELILDEDNIMNSIIKTDKGDFKLCDTNPDTGLLTYITNETLEIIADSDYDELTLIQDE